MKLPMTEMRARPTFDVLAEWPLLVTPQTARTDALRFIYLKPRAPIHVASSLSTR